MARSYADWLEFYQNEIQDARDDREEKVEMLFEDDKTLTLKYLKKLQWKLHWDRSEKCMAVAICRHRKTWGPEHKDFRLAKLLYERDLIKERFEELEKEWENQREIIFPEHDLFRRKLGVDMPAEYLNKIVRYIHTELYHHSSKPIRNKAIRRTKKAFLNAPVESRVNGLVALVADWDIRKINLERFEQGIVRRFERLTELYFRY